MPLGPDRKHLAHKAAVEAPPEHTREQADRQERRLASIAGFRLTAGSGSGGHAASKGDGQDELHVWESKTTTQKSKAVSRKEMAKVGRDAHAIGKEPILVITFEGKLLPGLSRDYAVVDLNYLMELLRGQEHR